MLHRVVSGGQTGVDRAALDAALAAGIAVGGWCPRGRLAEDGAVPARYPLTETKAPHYASRTRLNVRDSDATLVITGGVVSGGTLLTVEVARELRRPYHVARLPSTRPCDVLDWLDSVRPAVLNVAGPRAGEQPGIYAAARQLLDDVFARLSG